MNWMPQFHPVSTHGASLLIFLPFLSRTSFSFSSFSLPVGCRTSSWQRFLFVDLCAESLSSRRRKNKRGGICSDARSCREDWIAENETCLHRNLKSFWMNQTVGTLVAKGVLQSIYAKKNFSKRSARQRRKPSLRKV